MLLSSLIFSYIIIDFSPEIDDNTPIGFDQLSFQICTEEPECGSVQEWKAHTGGIHMKKCLALLLTFLIILTATACSASQTEATEAPTQEAAPTEYLPFEGETLTVLCVTGAHAEAARSMMEEFEAVTGAKVEVVDYEYQELHEQVLLDLTSYIGAYDVINIDSQWDGEFAPYLEPLEPYITQDKFDMNVWIENVLANCGQWQDTIVGIPTSSMPQVFAYRTDLLPNGIPNTWFDYRRILGGLNKPANGMYGIAVSKSPDQLVDMFNRVLWSMGGKWADENWKVTVNSNEGRGALNHLNMAKILSDPACLEWTPEDAIQAFLDGNAVVCEAWPDAILQKAEDPEVSQIAGNWSLGPIPHDKTNITALDAWDAVIPVAAQDKDLAWEWIKMYTSLEMQNRFYDEFMLFSPRKAFWEQEKMAELSVLREALDYANNAWRISAFLEAEPNISDALSSFLSGKTFLDTAIRKLDSEIKAYLEIMPPAEGTVNTQH